MLSILRTFGRVLWRHWPALLAWALIGELGSYAAIEISGFVGAYTSVGGLLLLPLAVLVRLVSFVAMFLVIRDALQNLQALAPMPASPAERRRTFVDALLLSILPFFAVYAAWGMLRDDVTAYSERALEVRQGLRFESILNGSTLVEDAVTNVVFSPLAVSIVLVAFSARWLVKRFAERLPKIAAVISVYLEAAWVFFTAFFVSNAIGSVTGWIDSRVATQWLADARQWFSDQLVPVAWIWDFVEWSLGAIGGVILEPLAWLAIAGVIYGQAIAPERLRVKFRSVETAKGRYERVPAVVRARIDDVADDFIGRFRPIGRSLLLMVRSGPLLLAGFVFAHAVLIFVENSVKPAIVLLFGPQDLYTFWIVADTLIFTLAALLMEPLRVVVVAVFYDATLGGLRRSVGAEAARADAAAQPPTVTGLATDRP